ncbi:MAG: methyltransferase domain-containing protein [Planctomycetes bacterium]|nr:methyltransferase domain-containing protein [Planctomycetota bacterium]
MSKHVKVSVVLIAGMCLPVLARRSNSRAGRGYREAADFVMAQLALEPGHVVADIGTGDGWWTKLIADRVGTDGSVQVGEVVQAKVDAMTKKYADTPQIKAYRCPIAGTGQPENSCDLVYISKSYHHLERQNTGSSSGILDGFVGFICFGELVVCEFHKLVWQPL